MGARHNRLLLILEFLARALPERCRRRRHVVVVPEWCGVEGRKRWKRHEEETEMDVSKAPANRTENSCRQQCSWWNVPADICAPILVPRIARLLLDAAADYDDDLRTYFCWQETMIRRPKSRSASLVAGRESHRLLGRLRWNPPW